MARPKKQIDYALVEELAKIMCTQEEIAHIVGCDVRTLQRDEEFCRIYKKGQENGKKSLRRIQFELAEKNATMAIWLGKQYLGQTDKIDLNTDENNSINIKMSTPTEEDIERVKKLRERLFKSD